MPAPQTIADQALALAASLAPGDDPGPAVGQLRSAGPRPDLELAQTALVRRLRARSDDFAATAALTLVNQALSQGWPDPFSWKNRRKP